MMPFRQLIKNLLLSSARSLPQTTIYQHHLNFSSQPDFDPVIHQKIVRAKGNPEREFILQPLTEEHIIDSARVISHNFCNGNASYRSFGLPEELFMERIALPLTHKNIREGLGAICIEKATNEVIGASLHEDFSTQKSDPYYINPHPILDRRTKISKYVREQNASILETFPKGKLEGIYAIYGATNESVAGLGIYSQIAYYITFDHPILKTSKMMWATCVHLGTYYGLTRSGWDVVWEKEWKDFANIKGYEEFAEVDKFADVSTERSKTNKIWLTVFDREKYEARNKQTEVTQCLKTGVSAL